MLAAASDARGRAPRHGLTLASVAVAGLAIATITCAEQPSQAAAPAARAQALAYEHGEGVPKDLVKAAALYCEAARSGDPEAMFSLGWMYANGRGVSRDDAIAASLFARAASFGHDYARRMLRFFPGDEGVVPACMLPPAPDAADTSAVDGADPFAELSPSKRKIADVVAQAAPTYGVDPRLALAIVAIESDFEPRAVSVKDARGVMQLVSDTAARFNVANRMDIAANVRGGLAYLRWLLAYYEGRVRLVVAAYNAGEAAVDKYRGVPPFRETRDYVLRVLRLFPDEDHPYDPAIAAPSPALARPGPDAQ